MLLSVCTIIISVYHITHTHTHTSTGLRTASADECIKDLDTSYSDQLEKIHLCTVSDTKPKAQRKKGTHLNYKNACMHATMTFK